ITSKIGDNVFLLWSFNGERNITRSRPEPFGICPSQVERTIDYPLLRHSAIYFSHDLLRAQACLKLCEHRRECVVIYSATIVWIYQVKIPEFAALVCIRNSRRGVI